MIILDAGHGYNTPGKRSPVWSDGTQLFEWEFTRDIVSRISEGLEKQHIPSIILAKEAIDLPLTLRVARANSIYAEDHKSFLLSVHANAGGGKGWEIWTSPGKTEADKIATIFYQNAKMILSDFVIRNDFTDGDPDKENKFYILAKTHCPAILTENLFYDNEAECRFLMSDNGRERIAQLHIVSIQSYLSKYDN
jgi:N-acetylmuramoyl-L-alanine amidase